MILKDFSKETYPVYEIIAYITLQETSLLPIVCGDRLVVVIHMEEERVIVTKRVMKKCQVVHQDTVNALPVQGK